MRPRTRDEVQVIPVLDGDALRLHVERPRSAVGIGQHPRRSALDADGNDAVIAGATHDLHPVFLLEHPAARGRLVALRSEAAREREELLLDLEAAVVLHLRHHVHPER